MKRKYDYIVLGCGGIGSGAMYWLSRRAGADVLGIEQFGLGHHKGGSQDHSRIIRLALYGEELTRLTPHTFRTWRTVAEEARVQIVTKTGGLFWWAKDAPTRNKEYMQATMAAMTNHNIPFDTIDADELMYRYPQFVIDEEITAVTQDETGIVNPHVGNYAHQQLARYHGATILDNCPVLSIKPFDGGVDLVTAQGSFSCRRLVITAGAWAGELLAQLDLDLKLTVTHEQVTYYATPNLAEFSVGRFPIFLTSTERGAIYGFPVHGEVATKAAIDMSGDIVTADTRSFEPNEEVEAYQVAWLDKHIPGFTGPRRYVKTCLYTMPPDRTFVMDLLPRHPEVILCVGAGHAFKFASLFGEILSELALDGRTDYPIEPFKLDRPGLTDPHFESYLHEQLRVTGRLPA